MAVKLMKEHTRWELHISRFCFYYHDWKAFSFTPWLPYGSLLQASYIVYRWVTMLFFLAYLLKIAVLSESAYLLEYLTIWGLISLVTYFTWSAITVTYTFVRVVVLNRTPHKPSQKLSRQKLNEPPGCCGASIDSTSWYHKILWVLFTISTETAVAITTLFWSVLYSRLGLEITDNDIAIHLLNGLVAYFELWVTGIPVRVYHFYLPCLFACVYSAFTGIHYVALVLPNATAPIYPVLDYSAHPGTGAAFAILGPLVLGPILHLIFYTSYLFREALLFALKRNCTCAILQDKEKDDSTLLLKEEKDNEST